VGDDSAFAGSAATYKATGFRVQLQQTDDEEVKLDKRASRKIQDRHPHEPYAEFRPLCG
jgi:hypothetical protein